MADINEFAEQCLRAALHRTIRLVAGIPYWSPRHDERLGADEGLAMRDLRGVESVV